MIKKYNNFINESYETSIEKIIIDPNPTEAEITLNELIGKKIEFYSEGEKKGPFVLSGFDFYNVDGQDEFKENQGYQTYLDFDGKYFILDINKGIKVLN